MYNLKVVEDRFKRNIEAIKVFEERGAAAAAKFLGVGQTRIYALRSEYRRVGLVGVHPKAWKHPKSTPDAVVKRILEIAADTPALGATRIGKILSEEGVVIHRNTIQKVLSRNNRARMEDRKREAKADVLRPKILESLEAQGFKITKDLRAELPGNTKEHFRRINEVAVAHRRSSARSKLARYEASFLDAIGNGADVVPERFDPELVEIQPKSPEELLYRYIALHWSIPLSKGYGRRLRYLIRDKSNGKAVGIIGLCDPVIAMNVRDQWVGWSKEARHDRLYSVLDAFVLGAVPPYNRLLCGKFVAMLACSNQVRADFERKYGNQKPLAMITTSSALGKSSVYNRIKLDDFAWLNVGFTKGWGEFHYANGLYTSMLEYASEFCPPTRRNEKWGVGFRNRQEVVQKTLRSLGLPIDLGKHGIKREFFAAPLGPDVLGYLRGEMNKPTFYDLSVDNIAKYFKERWLLPRSKRIVDWQEFNKDSYKLW